MQKEFGQVEMQRMRDIDDKKAKIAHYNVPLNDDAITTIITLTTEN